MKWIKIVWERGEEGVEYTITLSCKHFYLCFFPFLEKAAINAIVFLFDSNPLSFYLPRAPKSQQIMVVASSTLLSPPCNHD